MAERTKAERENQRRRTSEAKTRKRKRQLFEAEALKTLSEKPSTPSRGVAAKIALANAVKGNVKGFDKVGSVKEFNDTLDAAIEGEDQDFRLIEKYGDDAMKSKRFGSRRPVKKAKGGMIATKRYMNGGAVMSGRGVRDTKIG